MANFAGSSNHDVTLTSSDAHRINKVDGTMHVLFQKNQPLPDYKTRTTTSRTNQSASCSASTRASRLVAENELLGTFVFKGLRAAPKQGADRGHLPHRLRGHPQPDRAGQGDGPDRREHPQARPGQEEAEEEEEEERRDRRRCGAGRTGDRVGTRTRTGACRAHPFTMPSSSLMQDIGGPQAESTADSPTAATVDAGGTAPLADAPAPPAPAGTDAADDIDTALRTHPGSAPTARRRGRQAAQAGHGVVRGLFGG